MLSQQSRPYIDASVPVLREHGVTITRTFYKNMFAEHPELTNIFNMGNQASGAQQQSLASAVFAYAANIDNADALAPVVGRIVHKHASVGITASHYPIVGRHLLGAIQQTLGDAATPELLSAWAEAYGLLADALIDAERQLYAQAGIVPGELRDLVVTQVIDQSANVRSFVLQPQDQKPLMAFKPGQYISVEVNLPGGQRQLRQYSLSDRPGLPYYRISVKRETAGAETPAGQVSNWLHDNLTRGSVLRVSPPFGDFQPDISSAAPIVLLSAGVGITPMISTLNYIAHTQPSRRVIFAHAARDHAHHAHQDDVKQAMAIMSNLSVVNFYESLDSAEASDHGSIPGRMQVSLLPGWDHTTAQVYMCGPLPFMQQQWRDLLALGVPVEKIHREVFGPDMLDHLI